MYADILRRVRNASGRKRHEKWRTNSWFLRYTTMLQHTGRFGQEFLSKEQCDHSPLLLLPDYSRFLLVSIEVSIEGAALL